MTKSDLIAILCDETDLTVKQAKALIKTVFDEMSNALAKGDRVEIRGFCTMHVKNYDGYTGRNPKTGESVSIKPKNCRFLSVGKN